MKDLFEKKLCAAALPSKGASTLVESQLRLRRIVPFGVLHRADLLSDPRRCRDRGVELAGSGVPATRHREVCGRAAGARLWLESEEDPSRVLRTWAESAMPYHAACHSGSRNHY